MVSDEEFLGLLEKYGISLKKDDVISGTIVGYEGDYALVDINTKTSALCSKNEVILSKEQSIKDILKKGENYQFIVISNQDEDGIFYLSHKKIAYKQNIELLKEKLENNEIVTGKIINQTKGGLLATVMGLKGFIPISQMKIENYKIGDEIPLKILSLDLEKSNFILSNKKIYDDELAQIKNETLDKIELNMVVKGKVVRLADFGAFIDIGGIDGLLPLSQMSWKWIDDPNDILALDDVVDVEIIGIDKEKQRISLSLKSLEENPWLKAQNLIDKNEIMKAKVSSIKSFGTFVEIYPNIEGLLNKNQLKELFKKSQKELRIGDEIEVKIKKFDAINQKINLDIV